MPTLFALVKRYVAKNGLDNNSQTIINVTDPVNATDAATKNYVDTGNTAQTTTISTAQTTANTAVTNAAAASAAVVSETTRATTAEALLVPKTTTVNGLALSANITLTAANVGLGLVNNTADSTKTVLAAATATLASTVTTNANLTGDVTSVGNATTLTNAPVIAKVLTGFVSGAGTVTATDSILTAIQKLNGNDSTTATAASTAQTTANTAVTNAATANTAVATEQTRALAAEALLVPKTTTVNGLALSGNISLTAANVAAVATTSLGVANGVATLDATGKIPLTQITATIAGAMVYQGVWNASTNVPALASGVGTKGYFFKVSTAGTTLIDTLSQWNVGDLIIFDGTTWDKIDGIATEVTSVAGRVGAVVLTSADVGLGNVNNTADSTKAVLSAATATLAATVTTNANLTGMVTSVGNTTTVVTNANLTGEVTSVGNAATLLNSAVIGKVLTGYVSGAGVVAATDTILGAINKLNGNITAEVSARTASEATITTSIATAQTTANTAVTNAAAAQATANSAVTAGGNNLPLTYGGITSIALTTTTTTANQIVDQFAATAFTTIKYLIQASSAGAYHAMEVLVMHDGSQPYITEVADMYTTVPLVAISADVATGVFQLLATPTNAVTVIKVIRTAIVP